MYFDLLCNNPKQILIDWKFNHPIYLWIKTTKKTISFKKYKIIRLSPKSLEFRFHKAKCFIVATLAIKKLFPEKAAVVRTDRGV